MRRMTLAALVALAWSGAEARLQYVENYIAPGSTVAGDYLRGVGIEAAGLGEFNLKTAMAESIQADTGIRVDSYIREVCRQGRIQYAEHRQEIREAFQRNFEAIRRRLREHPDSQDVMSGNALNAVLEQLNDPNIPPSSFRLAPVSISIDDVRRIPFHLGEKGVVFSMKQLTARGKDKWPVAFQDARYDSERRAYERALDDALEHMIAKDVPEQVIKNYVAAVQGLANKLRQEPWPNTDKRRIEANLRLNEMTKAADLLKIQKIQPALAELDNYGGTSVNELRLFMRRHNLRFAVADDNHVRDLYPRLHEALVAVRETVLDQGKGPAK